MYLLQHKIMNNKLILLYGFAITAALSGCHSSAAPDPGTDAALPVTETFRLQHGQLSSQLQLPGELLARQQVDLYAKVASYVKELHVDIGSHVRAGALLLRLEAPELLSQMAGAESRLKSQEALYHASNATYNRLLETSKTPGTISQNDLDIAAARKNSDLAQLESARAAFKEVSIVRNYLEIRAPFDGIITARNVHAGAYVGPAGKGSELPLLTLQEQEHLRLAVAIPEASAAYIKDGSAVSFSVKSLPGAIFRGQVKRMSGALDLRLRSERIEMDIDNRDHQLLPGMVAEINMPLAARDSALIIPATALVRSDEGLYVIRVTGGKTNKVQVKKGREMDNQVEIYGELRVGDTLVTKASEELRNGTILSRR